MKILSIHDGHNASAAVFNGGKVLSAVSEERLNRDKFYWGFPYLSIKQALVDADISMSDIDCITVSHLNTWQYIKRKIALRDINVFRPKIFLGNMYNVGQVFSREIRIRFFGLKYGCTKFYFCDHHYAHALSAYHFGGFKDALVLTIDGLGDSLSHTAYSVREEKWSKLTEGGSSASLGTFYAAVTEGLGFKPNRHEGKIVGLAALGNPAHVHKEISELASSIQDNLSFIRKGYRGSLNTVKELLERGVSKEDIAAAAQNVLETLIIEHVKTLLKKSGQNNIVCAGGVFANVKLNQKILEECGVKDIFIQPAMGDEGLVLGAPFGLEENKKTVNSIDNVYLGNLLSIDEAIRLARKFGYTVEELKDPARETAEFVMNGKIVGWCDGRMEFGPRALGHRSIIADPRNKEINNVLNKRLRRSEFMPFAPSVLYEKRHDVCHIKENEAGTHAAEFMTITFNIKKEWEQKISAVVHTDGTARPQFVRKETNQAYHAVLESFYNLTGIPLFMNTSFNLHEEPIVATAQDALRALSDGAVDIIVFNNSIAVFNKTIK